MLRSEASNHRPSRRVWNRRWLSSIKISKLKSQRISASVCICNCQVCLESIFSIPVSIVPIVANLFSYFSFSSTILTTLRDNNTSSGFLLQHQNCIFRKKYFNIFLSSSHFFYNCSITGSILHRTQTTSYPDLRKCSSPLPRHGARCGHFVNKK